MDGDDNVFANGDIAGQVDDVVDSSSILEVNPSRPFCIEKIKTLMAFHLVDSLPLFLYVECSLSVNSPLVFFNVYKLTASVRLKICQTGQLK